MSNKGDKTDREGKGLKQLKLGQMFLGYCVIRKTQLKFKATGEPYLVLELGDCSGRLNARLWEDARKLSAVLKPGTVLKVKGKIQSFHGFKELKILKWRQANESDKVELSQLLPCSSQNIADLRERFESHYAEVSNPHLKALLASIYDQPGFREKFLQLPAGKLWHHNYLFGMLEHLVFLLDLAQTAAFHYPRVNKDLLYAGILCHNLGKIKAFRLTGYIEYSDAGRLIGSEVLGYETVKEHLSGIQDFPPRLAKELLHLMLSHTVRDEQALIVPPMTLEAIILQKLNELDINVNAFNRVLEKDVLPGEEWSKYVPLLDRFVYAAGVAEPAPEAARDTTSVTPTPAESENSKSTAPNSHRDCGN